MPNYRGLSIKQHRFIREYIANGGNGTAAALVAYDTNNVQTAAQLASGNLDKPKVQTALVKALEDQGLTTHELARLHRRVASQCDSDEPRAQAVGLRAVSLAYKVRGDIVETPPARSLEESTVNVLIMALRDIRVPQAPDIVDVTPIPSIDEPDPEGTD